MKGASDDLVILCYNPPEQLMSPFLCSIPFGKKIVPRTSTEGIFGLGLSIVNTFTRALGGNVKVHP